MARLEGRYGRSAVVDALRAEAAAARARLSSGAGHATEAGEIDRLIEEAAALRLAREGEPSLRRVINATGVVLHTNLGRAPLGRQAAARVAALAAGYTNLEYDIANGTRGRRDMHAARLLCQLTGAEAAVVVNNNAAATLLVLAAVAAGREAIVSRGELVEIGGGFRVPDVMAQSGAVLREVGTTNKTRAADYAAALSDRTAVILRVHPSNFRIDGFTERPTLEELVALGRRFNVPVVEDLGSGYLKAGPTGPLHAEPTVERSVAAGADAVMFSGDKLLGGPQAGIIVGAEQVVSRVRAHPLMRALRVDKLTYAALEATLQEFAAERAHLTIPVVRMLALTLDEIDTMATALAAMLSKGGLQTTVIDGESAVGGGSAPGSRLPTRLVAVSHPDLSATRLEARIRSHEVPVIARIDGGRVLLDPRTIDPDDYATLRGAFAERV
jgi:L-seryl-tRNA(Ser) seleniumtransferase